jgi:hypothetical protein
MTVRRRSIPAWKASRPSGTAFQADGYVYPIASSHRDAQGPSIPQRLGWIDRDGNFLLFAGPADKSSLAQSRIGRSPSAGAVSRRSRKRRRGNQRPCAKSRPSSLFFVSRRRRCRYPIVRIFVISPRDASARRSKMTAPCRMAMSRAAAKACRAASMLPRPSASRHSPRRR